MTLAQLIEISTVRWWGVQFARMDALLELRPTATGAAAISEECIGEDESLRLTRSFTIFHALMRIFGSGNLPSHLVLHILGADHRYRRAG